MEALATLNNQRQFDFQNNGIEVMDLETLQRTYKENDIYGNPVRGIYHYQVIQRMTALVAGEDKAAQRAAVKRSVRVENLAAEFCANRRQCQPARLRQRAGELIAVDDGGAERLQCERNGGFSTGNTACQTDDAHEDSSFRRAKRIFNRTIQRGKRLQISAKSSDRRSKTPRQGVFFASCREVWGKIKSSFPAASF